MQIESRKKKLCLEPLRGIITQGEKMADTVIFRLPATYGALILSDLSWQIRAASEKNTLATADLTASASGEFCLVQWEVSADFTAVSGALSLMLVGTDSEGDVVIKFPGDDPVWVRDAETGQYSPPEDAIQKALNGLQQAESTLEDATKALQEIGINFKILGHYGTLPELEAAVTNPSPGDAYGVGDPTVVYVWNGTSWAPLPGVFQPYPHNNLLVNPRFKYNSRGQTNYSASTNIFTLDGWMLQAQQNHASISVMDSGIKLNLTNTNQGIRQDFYDYDIPENVQMTSSICIDGVIYSDSFTSSKSGTVNLYPNQGFSYALVFSDGLWHFYPIVDYDEESSTYNITAAKLELGSVSTLQAELDNPPPEDVEKLKLDMYSLDPGRCAYLPWHNENLLDNWYFVGGGSQQGGGQFPINQRGQTSYSGSVYGIDRWRNMDTLSQVILNSNGLTIKSNGASQGPKRLIYQPIENPNQFSGKTLTISALTLDVPDNTFYISIRQTSSNGVSNREVNLSSNSLNVSTQTLLDNLTALELTFGSKNVAENQECSIQAVKLELGYLSTLARKDEEGNWVLNDPPPNFQQELAKCQRYQYMTSASSEWVRVSYNTGSVAYFDIPCPAPMRANPTVAQSTRMKVTEFGTPRNILPDITFSAVASGASIRLAATGEFTSIKDVALEMVKVLFDSNL